MVEIRTATIAHLETVAETAARALEEGLGTALLRDGIEMTQASSLPDRLETAKERNARFHERLGFVTVGEDDAPEGGPHIWFMRRAPGSGGAP